MFTQSLQLHYVGGYNGTAGLSLVYRYDKASGQWQDGSRMLESPVALSVAVGPVVSDDPTTAH